MAYTLHPAHPSDAASLAHIFETAFAEDKIIYHLHPGVPDYIRAEDDIKWMTGLIVDSPKFGSKVTKVVEVSSGDAVAFAKWDYPVVLSEELKN